MIKLGMLGTLSLTDANGREVRTVLRQPRRLALLAYLAAATPRGFHHRDGLLALFWPELDQEHARAALRQALHVVRDALGADVIVTRGDEEVGLDFERLWCDVVAFDCAMAAGHLHEALEHYRGDLLNGFFIAGAGEVEQSLVGGVRARETAAPRELASSALSAPRRVAPAPEPPRGRRVLWPAVIAAVVAGLVFSTAGDWRGRLWPRPVTGRVQALAVLPLANLSADTLRSWYADGLTEALTTDLGRIRSLLVIARGSVTPFRGTSKPLQEIARELHVDAVVEGGVQEAGGVVRVDVRLIRAATGYQLWADRFEEPVQNRFALEDRVARGIVSALELRLTASEEHALHAAPTKNLEAYDSYLRGKIRLRRENRADDSVAITLLERAVALDPDFAVAQAELGHAYVLRVILFAPSDTALIERAWMATEKALRLDPDLAEAHFTRASVLSNLSGRFAPEPAIQEDRRALELNPNLAQAHHGLGTIYLHLGLFEKAMDEFRRTLAIDPGYYGATRRTGLVLVYQGHYEDGLRLIQQVPPESNQALWNYSVASALLYLGRNAEAAALMERYL